MQSSNSFEDQAPVDEIYSTRMVIQVMAARVICPIDIHLSFHKLCNTNLLS